jgi:hypothetical protein
MNIPPVGPPSNPMQGPQEPKPTTYQKFIAAMGVGINAIAQFFNGAILGLRGVFFKAQRVEESQVNPSTVQKVDNIFVRFLRTIGILPKSTPRDLQEPLLRGDRFSSMNSNDFNDLSSEDPSFEELEGFRPLYDVAGRLSHNLEGVSGFIQELKDSGLPEPVQSLLKDRAYLGDRFEGMSLDDFNQLETNHDLALKVPEFKRFYDQAKTFHTFKMTETRGHEFIQFQNNVNDSKLPDNIKRQLIAMSILNSFKTDETLSFTRDENVVEEVKDCVNPRAETDLLNLFRGFAFSTDPCEFTHYVIGDQLLVNKSIIDPKHEDSPKKQALEDFKTLLLEQLRLVPDLSTKSSEDLDEYETELLKLLDPPTVPLMSAEFRLSNPSFPQYDPSNILGYICEGISDSNFNALVPDSLISVIIPPLQNSATDRSDAKKIAINCVLNLEDKTVEWKYFSMMQINTNDVPPTPIFEDGIMFERTLKFDFSKGFGPDEIQAVKVSTRLEKIKPAEFSEKVGQMQTVPRSDEVDFVKI